MATFRDLLSAAKSVITEVDTATAQTQISAGGVTVLDVREPDEYAEGALVGALHIPRGHLEAQIEGRILDKESPVIVYCAGGVRSALPPRPWPNLVTPMFCRWLVVTASGKTRVGSGKRRHR